MSKDKSKRYYWLKLKKDFFKRHDIRIIEEMENGKDYIIFYLKLLTESISHEGRLRFNDTIPYDEKMLATITNTNVDIVRSAVKVFQGLHLMEVWDDQTIYMTETQKMIGSETGWAIEKREYRAKQEQLQEPKDNVKTKKDNVQQEIELDIELELDKDIDIYKKEKSNKKEKKVKSDTNEFQERFAVFWKHYPRKESKKKASEYFIKKKVSQELLEKILESLELHKKYVWADREINFIPHSTTWLNQERWNDEIIPNGNNEQLEKVELHNRKIL